jgi:hypothetical protein
MKGGHSIWAAETDFSGVAIIAAYGLYLLSLFFAAAAAVEVAKIPAIDFMYTCIKKAAGANAPAAFLYYSNFTKHN